MLIWKKIDKSTPLGTKILVLWSKTNHVEDAVLYDDGLIPNAIYHVLFDGESMNDEPDYWMPYPTEKETH